MPSKPIGKVDLLIPTAASDAVDDSHHRQRDLPNFGVDQRTPNVSYWLQADMQPPEIDFRLAPESGHSEANAGLPLLTQAV